METLPQYIEPDLTWADFESQYSPTLEGRGHFWFVFVIVAIYGLIGIIGGPIPEGNYVLKAIPCLAIMTLAFSRVNRLVLIGFAIPLYFHIRFATRMEVLFTYPLMVEMGPVIILIAWFVALMDDLLIMPGQVQRPRTGSIKWLLGLFVLWCTISIIGSQGLHFHRWFRQWFCIAAVVAAFDLTTRSRINQTTVSRMLLGLMVCYYAIYLPLVLAGFTGITPESAQYVRGETTGQLGSQSGLMLIIFAFSIGLYVSSMPKKMRKRILIFCAVPAVFLILWYISKAAILISALMVVLALVFSKNRANALVITVILCIGIFAAITFIPGLGEAVEGRFDTIGGAWATRKGIQKEAFNFALKNPVFGIGQAQYPLRSQAAVQSAHNEGLNILAELGFIGLMIYLSILCIFIFKIVTNRKIPDPFTSGIIRGTIFAGIAYLLYTQVQPLYFGRRAIPMLVFLGMVYVCTMPRNEQYAISVEDNTVYYDEQKTLY